MRRLGARGKGGSAQQEAASVASLIGESSAADALATACRHFRGQPLHTLTRDQLIDNQADPTLQCAISDQTLPPTPRTGLPA